MDARYPNLLPARWVIFFTISFTIFSAAAIPPNAAHADGLHFSCTPRQLIDIKGGVAVCLA